MPRPLGSYPHSARERDVCPLSAPQIWIASSQEILFTKRWLFGDHLYDFGPLRVFRLSAPSLPTLSLGECSRGVGRSLGRARHWTRPRPSRLTQLRKVAGAAAGRSFWNPTGGRRRRQTSQKGEGGREGGTQPGQWGILWASCSGLGWGGGSNPQQSTPSAATCHWGLPVPGRGC